MEPSALTGISGSLIRMALDGLSARQLATANNIANANTPGYAPVRVAFEDQLATALRDAEAHRRVDPGRLAPTVAPEATPGALVQLDLEAAQMAQDVLHYQALLRALRGQMDILSTAINEGKR
jgi:flagellar basal-body rod protein FlgB